MPDQNRIRVAVLFGGRSGEHDVSCASAAGILTHLDRARYQVRPVRVSTDGEWVPGPVDLAAGSYSAPDLARLLPGRGAAPWASLVDALPVLGAADVVLPVLHGPYGEDGTVQGLLETLGVPYVGNGVLASAAGMDKDVTKRLLASAGLPVAASVLLPRREHGLTPGDRERLGLPVFVKPARAGSSLGVTRVDSWDALEAAVDHARVSDSKVLVEEAVLGREVDVAVLEHPDGRLEVGPALEIRVRGGQAFFDYDAKYQDSATRFEIPARLPAGIAERLREMAVAVFETLGCAGLLRIDFLLRDGTEPVVNEVNTFPGFTATSQYPRIWAATGLLYEELLDVLIATALAGAADRSAPGAGAAAGRTAGARLTAAR
ncbi:D-alanine--D-alanine ligase [Kitasatospora sp. NBC_01287]|uniref:D-alanine--D-alanine ligase family protein n=1 Tax=Kitasatospora sp. NBC_01287 TaxID=2903573 RepID=UPI002252CDDA|nr:D-alanine--D-alanine ligase family protein [Kitasatospora sp. NBC_01287]MCX4750420.1 D-alanine--D-alanine ligase [Kitasatospora sp. NBC_01287]